MGNAMGAELSPAVSAAIRQGIVQLAREDARTERMLACGAIRGGVTAAGAFAWLGIPYAEAPIGPRRWRAPVEKKAWHDCYAAQSIGSPGSQQQLLYGEARATGTVYVGSEDCLFLNIFAPAGSGAGSALPVMVWVHGGGNVRCHGGTFDGSVLATTQNVIVVTFNFRLGMFGWFRHAALRAEASSDAERSGNFALLDMIALLRWVRTHIAEFGGNPDCVTVFGESSGGANVFALLASPLAAGLFQRAIVQSGSPASIDAIAAEHYLDDTVPGLPQSSGELVLHTLLCEGEVANRGAAKRAIERMQPAALAAYLRSKSFIDFDRAYLHLYQGMRALAATQGFPQPIRDGTVMPLAEITTALETIPSLPVILGSTRDEYASSALAQLFNERRYYLLAAEYLVDLFKAYAVDTPAQALVAAGAQVFVYRFDWGQLSPPTWMPNIELGATHGIDVPFVFGHLQLGAEFYQLPLFGAACLPSFHALSQQMMSYWAAFARHGTPGCGAADNLPRWSQWCRGKRTCGRTRFFDEGARGVYKMLKPLAKVDILARLRRDTRFDNARERCEFLRQLLSISNGFGLLNATDYAHFVGGIEVAAGE